MGEEQPHHHYHLHDEPALVRTAKNGVVTLRFNRPERCNAWSPDVLEAMEEALKETATDESVKAVILTGSGKYYCSGVDFAGSLKAMWPKALLETARKNNQALFDAFLDFPKPLFAAVNGPAIGASVTSATLCDAIIAAPSATFHTPFAALGITPEGCSSVLFEKLLGKEIAKQMLEDGRKLSSIEAKNSGLVAEVVHSDKELQDFAQHFAEEWIRSGKAKRHAGEVEWLKKVNAEESKYLALSFLRKPFLQNQYEFAAKKGRKGPAAMFWVAKTVAPLLPSKL